MSVREGCREKTGRRSSQGEEQSTERFWGQRAEIEWASPPQNRDDSLASRFFLRSLDQYRGIEIGGWRVYKRRLLAIVQLVNRLDSLEAINDGALSTSRKNGRGGSGEMAEIHCVGVGRNDEVYVELIGGC